MLTIACIITSNILIFVYYLQEAGSPSSSRVVEATIYLEILISESNGFRSAFEIVDMVRISCIFMSIWLIFVSYLQEAGNPSSTWDDKRQFIDRLVIIVSNVFRSVYNSVDVNSVACIIMRPLEGRMQWHRLSCRSVGCYLGLCEGILKRHLTRYSQICAMVGVKLSTGYQEYDSPCVELSILDVSLIRITCNIICITLVCVCYLQEAGSRSSSRDVEATICLKICDQLVASDLHL